MRLELNQIKEHLKSPQSRNQIEQAIKLNSWIRFHTDTEIDVKKLTYYNTFTKWLSEFLPDDKVKRFKSLLKSPVYTNELTESIFNEIGKIFETSNKNIKYNFKDNDLAIDFDEYRKQSQDYWQTDGFENYQSNVNSFIVVDLPAEQITDRPEPYFYVLDMDKVVDVSLSGQDVHWIIFRCDDTIYVYDSESYRVYEEHNNTLILISESFHDLGYTPVHLFWNDKLNKKSKISRINVLGKSLYNLDWLLFFETAKKYLDLYAPFPIYAHFEEECDYTDEDGHECNNGLLFNTNGEAYLYNDKHVSCPSCSNNNLIAPGTFVKVPVPRDKEDFNMMPPIQVIGSEIDSCDYVRKEVDLRNKEIYNSAVGVVNNDSEQAKNELQIMSSFESRKSILDKVRYGFEEIIKWTESTVASLRYGDVFVNADVSLGDGYFLNSTESLQKEFEQLKEGSFPESEIDRSYTKIIETKYKNNPVELERENILLNLNPFPYVNDMEELRNDLISGLISAEDYKIKRNFSALVKRFERENAPIHLFGADIDFDRRIDIIKEQLVKYVNS
jgi:hypothetical protein